MEVLSEYVPVSVRLPIRGAQLATLRGRRKLPNPGKEQQTLVAGVPLQLGGNRLHPIVIHRKDTGKHRSVTGVLIPTSGDLMSHRQVKGNLVNA